MDIKELKERLETLINKIGKLQKCEQESFIEWVTHLLAKDSYEVKNLSEKIQKEDDEIMLADLMMQLREEWDEEARKKDNSEFNIARKTTKVLPSSHPQMTKKKTLGISSKG